MMNKITNNYKTYKKDFFFFFVLLSFSMIPINLINVQNIIKIKSKSETCSWDERTS